MRRLLKLIDLLLPNDEVEPDNLVALPHYP